MHVLEMDAGNSRIKWRLTDLTSTQAQGSVELATANEKSLADVFRQISVELSGAALLPDRVRVSSVRGQDVNTIVEKEVSKCWNLKPEFAKVSKECAGVTNSYKDVSRMGVDRWLAILAAFNNFSGSICVVDAGSALTVDLVDGEGQHLGGYITPGLEMMLESMMGRSSALRLGDHENNKVWSGTGPGRDTSGAMHQGVLSMTCGWLNQLHKENGEFHWVFTGGDASMIMPHLDFDITHRPMLVLDGLSFVLP